LVCLGEALTRQQLFRFLEPVLLQDLESLSVLLQDRDKLGLAVRILPWLDHWYVAESPTVTAARRAASLPVAHIADQTWLFTQYLGEMARQRPLRRFLEVGCGIGITLLELRDMATERLGWISIHET
jgi:hypothetical protein